MRGLENLLARSDVPPCTLVIQPHAGGTLRLGHGEPAVHINVRSPNGQRALESLNELAIAEAYMRGDLDFEGDFINVMSLRRVLSDNNRWIKTWRWLRPLLTGRERCNPEWIAKHYDAGNIQLLAAEQRYNTYTPGIYDGEGDSLEDGAERKLSAAFDALNLKPGDSHLDIGCGWGGFLRFCERQGVRATGITLSRDQLAYSRVRLGEEGRTATVVYQDFFTFDPERAFDGISMMGVMEDLSDYRRVLGKLSGLIRPGGRIYLDFAACTDPVSSFITKHIWPGTFRMVHMPELIECVSRSPFELVALHNDRMNYYLWSLGVLRRWEERKSEVLQRADVATWRMFRLLYAGTAALMGSPLREATAYRMVLERA